MLQFRFENKFSGSYIYITNRAEGEEYRYDVSGYISMRKIYKERGIDYSVLSYFIRKLVLTGRQIEKDGRDINGMILNPEYIFFRLAGKADSIKILYFPKECGIKFEKEMLYLGEYLIKHVDYSDIKAVRLAYELYKRIYQGVFIFEDLLA